MARKVSEFLAELADREAIRETLMRYPRSLDRLDMDLAATLFWPDAVDDHCGIFTGKLADFFEFAEPELRKMSQTQHLLSNILIEIDGFAARTETYVVGYHELSRDKQNSTFLAAGRYLDRFEKRDDEWRISDRVLIIDWMKHIPDSPQWSQDFLGHIIGGSRVPADRSTGHFVSM